MTAVISRSTGAQRHGVRHRPRPRAAIVRDRPEVPVAGHRDRRRRRAAVGLRVHLAQDAQRDQLTPIR